MYLKEIGILTANRLNSFRVSSFYSTSLDHLLLKFLLLSKSFPSVLPKVKPNYQLIYHSPAHHKNQTKHAPIYQRKKSNSPLAAQHSRHVDTKPRNSGS